MRELLFWALITLALAVFLHLAAVWYLPRLITLVSARKLLRTSGRWNVLSYRGLPKAGGKALTSNPDMATASGVYDATAGPVRIACVLPGGDRYWSLSLYAWNTENFYVVNDRTAPAQEFSLVITTSGTRYGGSKNETLIVSPSKKGVIVVRMLVPDRSDRGELERVEEAMKKTAIGSESVKPLPDLRTAAGGAASRG
jgi:uncharacterized membrane protein